jgi:hypothetical protein
MTLNVPQASVMKILVNQTALYLKPKGATKTNVIAIMMKSVNLRNALKMFALPL